MTPSKMKRASIKTLEMERASAKMFANQYSKTAQETLDSKEAETASKMASEYMQLAGDITRELAIRQIMKGGK